VTQQHADDRARPDCGTNDPVQIGTTADTVCNFGNTVVTGGNINVNDSGKGSR
jgi:hypothetical protein